MTIFQFWEKWSIGHLSPIFSADCLVAFTIMGCVITFVQIIVACSSNFTKHPEYGYKDYAPYKILGTMYAPLFVIAVALASVLELVIMIQMSFAVWATVSYCVFLVVLFVMKIVKAVENEKSLFGLIGWIQTLAVEYVVKPSRTFFFKDWVERLYILHRINKSQNKYLRNESSPKRSK